MRAAIERATKNKSEEWEVEEEKGSSSMSSASNKHMNISNVLFFDIETVSSRKSYTELSPSMQEHRDHKMNYELTKQENA